MENINEKYELVPVDALKTHPKNPKKHDDPAITESLEVNGFFGAVVVQKSTGHILAGNGRYRNAVKLGAETVPVLWVDVTDEQALKILLADNRTHDLAGYNDERLKEILGSLSDLTGTGFDDSFFDADDEDAPVTLLDQAIQLKPAREYIVIACESEEDFSRLKEKLQLQMVRRGGYKPGSPFDDSGIERVIPAGRLIEALK